MKKACLILVVVILLTACGGQTDIAPEPESDSSQRYRLGSEIPVDDNVYTINGRVVGDVDSLTRQTAAARVTNSTVYADGYTRSSSTYFAPELNGKGFVRLLVYSSEPETDLAQPENIVIIKTTDTKATMLLAGDVVTFRCRAQYEAVAAIRNNETFRAEDLGTWELDYCRLSSPLVAIESGR